MIKQWNNKVAIALNGGMYIAKGVFMKIERMTSFVLFVSLIVLVWMITVPGSWSFGYRGSWG